MHKPTLKNAEEYCLVIIPVNGGEYTVLDIVTISGDEYFSIGSDESSEIEGLEIILGPLNINKIASELIKAYLIDLQSGYLGIPSIEMLGRAGDLHKFLEDINE